MIKCSLGLQLSVWIMQVSIFSIVHINRFHCSNKVLQEYPRMPGVCKHMVLWPQSYDKNLPDVQSRTRLQ